MLKLLYSSAAGLLKLKNSTGQILARIGILTLRDLIFYYPTSYQAKLVEPNIKTLQEHQLVEISVTIRSIFASGNRTGPLKILARCETGTIGLIFFNKVPPFMYAKLKVGTHHIVTGRIQFFNKIPQIVHPEFIFDKSLKGPIEPIYALTHGLSNKQIYTYINSGLKIIELRLSTDKASDDIAEYMKKIVADLRLVHYQALSLGAISIINTLTPDFEKLRDEAIERLAQAELYANQAGLSLLRNARQPTQGRQTLIDKDLSLKEQILKHLGFELTEPQKKVIAEIQCDQQKDVQMMRLLQGDVGSGKTLVALLIMLNVIKTGAQAALMAPIDLLANQHYHFFTKALANLPQIKIALLTGKIKGKVREALLQDLQDSKIDILIGTHALFQEKVNYKNLGLAVIDEQHRFGVEQRASLIKKAFHPDVLVMTATPIPRSLTLTMFGDMDSSKLDGKPANRLPIQTSSISSTKVNEVVQALERKIVLKEKIYWICALISQNDEELIEVAADDAIMDVTSRYNILNQSYPGQVGLLHGRLKKDEKDKIMHEFKHGDINILVATTVVEVGVDVSNATIIIIENAEKFGLAQMHQLRGRVGRSHLQSSCVLLYNANRLSNIAKKRLEIMRATNDGFYIAEQDLILRGSGDIAGTKQSGEPEFYFANIARDMKALTKANMLTQNIINSDFINFQIKLFERRSLQILKSG